MMQQPAKMEVATAEPRELAAWESLRHQLLTGDLSECTNAGNVNAVPNLSDQPNFCDLQHC